MTRKRPRGFDSHYGSFRAQHTQCHYRSHPPYQEQCRHTSPFHYNLIPPPSREQYRPPPSHTHSAFAAAPEYYYEEGRVSELNDPCVVSGGDGEKVVTEEPGKDPCVVSSFKDERKKVQARKIQKKKEVKPNEVEKFGEAEKNQNGEGPYGITCQRLFMQLQQAMQDREREVKKREDKLDAALANVENQKKATEAERTWIETTRKELADLREHIEIERLKMEEQAKEARAERELIERINTDIAVQTAEMKRTRREVEKNLSELHASKDELNKRRKELGMQELVLPAIKHEMGKQIQSIHANKDQVEAKERHLVEKPKVIKCENEELRHARLATSIETSEMPMRYEGKPLNSKKASGKSNQLPIQIALQEDAPELFQVLEEKGLLDEMKDVCSVWDDTWESSGNCEDDFKSLAWVVNKVWGAATLLPKESRSRLQNLTGGNKVAYCLSCLVSLIEQAKSILQRKWPVKWGWCRQLCAFLFVFEKHNRIVLERPEYGYATYFFELVQGVPVKWQVDRLIQVMTTTTNCRSALLENRPLEIGEDLTIEEAAILEEYGWNPNSGLGSLLNFCDRISHDYKTESETADWRTKVGKFLMDGYDHGRKLCNIPHRLQISDVASSQHNDQAFSCNALCKTAKEEPF